MRSQNERPGAPTRRFQPVKTEPRPCTGTSTALVVAPPHTPSHGVSAQVAERWPLARPQNMCMYPPHVHSKPLINYNPAHNRSPPLLKTGPNAPPKTRPSITRSWTLLPFPKRSDGPLTTLDPSLTACDIVTPRPSSTCAEHCPLERIPPHRVAETAALITPRA